MKNFHKISAIRLAFPISIIAICSVFCSWMGHDSLSDLTDVPVDTIGLYDMKSSNPLVRRLADLQQQGENEKALQLTDTMLMHCPNSWAILSTRGHLFEEVGKRKEAEESRRKAISILDSIIKKDLQLKHVWAIEQLISKVNGIEASIDVIRAYSKYAKNELDSLAIISHALRYEDRSNGLMFPNNDSEYTKSYKDVYKNYVPRITAYKNDGNLAAMETLLDSLSSEYHEDPDALILIATYYKDNGMEEKRNSCLETALKANKKFVEGAVTYCAPVINQKHLVLQLHGEAAANEEAIRLAKMMHYPDDSLKILRLYNKN